MAEFFRRKSFLCKKSECHLYKEAARISKAMITDEFSEKIDRLTKSSTYLDYCEEVYGYRVYLFNMMDKQQIDFILNAIPVTEKDTLLDLGCGSGLFSKAKLLKRVFFSI
jgi:cyclopropane fatty-acyl-phospholipid synthase-like methyltransferase